MKRITLCCDGTWNEPDKTKEGIPLATNVVKIAEAVLPVDEAGVAQLVYYDPGVGTAGSRSRRILDGASGRGLSTKLLEAYDYLALRYTPGDQVFMFGFSRGAFTVRSLGGMIRKCGVLRAGFRELAPQAYRFYRQAGAAAHPREREATLFRKTYSVEDKTPIHFIGVWDTVGALGNPLLLDGIVTPKNRFHDLELSSTVSYAYQALAVDEKRRHFQAALWNQQSHAKTQTMEQAWFAGVHSNVGGGYASTALSDLALEWMVTKARACGLALAELPVRPQPLAPCEESRKGFYRLLPAFHRPIGRPAEGRKTNESLHPSLLARFAADAGYRPPNLVDYLRRQAAAGADLPAAVLAALRDQGR